jgi:hypothetical protein
MAGLFALLNGAMDTKKLSYELLKTLPNRIWQNKTKIKEVPVIINNNILLMPLQIK